MCVRVTDLRGVDLDTYRFDFDLTFQVLVMNGDGTVYHRFGSRSSESADGLLRMTALVGVLEAGLAAHAEHEPLSGDPSPPKTLDDYPVWQEKLADVKRQKRSIDCYHCHFVFETERRQAVRDGTWERPQIWRWPPPEQVGLELDPERPQRIVTVLPESPAAKAGLQAGDRLLRAGTQPIASLADLSSVLEDALPTGARVPLQLEREGESRELTLELPPGWRVGTPQQFAWRPSKWGLEPKPGFGGPPLNPKQKAKLGLDPDAFALRVNYLVTWGDDPRYGKAVVAAGLRKGDVLVGVEVDGERVRLESGQHLHSWWRLTRSPGERVRLVVRRREQELNLEVEVLPPQ